MDSDDRITDEQIKQVFAEETYSRSDWPAQMEYLATAVCCWSAESEALLDVEAEGEVIPFCDVEALLASGDVLGFDSFRLNSL